MISATYPKELVITSARIQIEKDRKELEESLKTFDSRCDVDIKQIMDKSPWWKMAKSYEETKREFFQSSRYYYRREYSGCYFWEARIAEMEHIIRMCEICPNNEIILDENFWYILKNKN